MPSITIEQEELEELIEKTVQKQLQLTVDDMEVVRRSPAAAIIRREGKIENVVTKDDFNVRVGRLEGKIENMVTKDEFNVRVGRLEDRMDNTFTKIEFREKVTQIEGATSRNSSLLKLLIALYLSGIAIVGAMFAKMFFF